MRWAAFPRPQGSPWMIHTADSIKREGREEEEEW